MLQYGFNTIINHQFGMVITIILWQGWGLVSYFTTNEPSRFMKDPLFCSIHHWHPPWRSIHHHPRVNWTPPGWVAMAHEVGICWLRTHLAPHQDASVHTVAAGALHPFPTWAGPRRQRQGGGNLRKPSPFGKKSTNTTVSFVFFRTWHQQEPHATWIKTWIPFAKGRITWQHALLDPIGTWTLSKDER